MPLYTYRCVTPTCGRQFEVQQRMRDEPLQDCPVCAGTVRRLINNVGVVFKGNGYYVTDSRKNGTSSHQNGHSKPTETTSETISSSEKVTTEKTTTAETPTTS